MVAAGEGAGLPGAGCPTLRSVGHRGAGCGDGLAGPRPWGVPARPGETGSAYLPLVSCGF